MAGQSSYTRFHDKVLFASKVVCIITLFFLSLLITHNTAYAAVVVNELLPVANTTDQVYIELYNNGTDTVSLDRWKLQNTTGDVKTFILNASWLISPHTFLTFTGEQTGISFSTSGDTVELIDVNNTKVDSQSFPSILGYNNSMGRSSDGGGTWAMCTLSTFNLPNNCPEPSPTTTPLPTDTPLPTPLPTDTPIPVTPTDPAQQTIVSPLSSSADIQINKTGDYLSPTPTPDSTNLTLTINKNNAFLILFVLIAWGIIAAVAYVRYKKKRRLTL